MTTNEQMGHLVRDYSGELGIIQPIDEGRRNPHLAVLPSPRAEAGPVTRANSHRSDRGCPARETLESGVKATGLCTRVRGDVESRGGHSTLQWSTRCGGGDQTRNGKERAEHAADSNRCAAAAGP